MEYKDYYRILGVARDASQDDIKRAYRRLARKYHPDVSEEQDAEARFQELQEAYEVLKDPEKRAAYDRFGEHWREGQDSRPGEGAPDFDFDFAGGGFTAGDASGFSDFFESLFGRGAGRRTGGFHSGFHGRGDDHFARVELTLEEAYHGGTRRISLETPKVTADGRIERQARSVDVRIPAGVTEGQQIRVPGQGGRGLPDGRSGDLYLEVVLRPHALYRAEGRDIHIDLPIAPWEAALGAKVTVPTLGGEVEARIPAGARSGQQLRLKGRGLPGSPPGDQYLHLRIVTPPAQTDAERQLYERMRAEMDFDPRASLKRRAS